MGGLQGGAGTILQGGTNFTTYSIGALNTDGTFAGSIQNNGAGVTSITKVGTGGLTISGTISATGTTSIVNGGFRLTGTSAGAVNVGNGTANSFAPSLSGTGGIGGLTTSLAGTNNTPHLAPGVNSTGALLNFGGVGTLKLNGGLNLGSSTELDLDLDQPNVTAGTGNNDLFATTALTIGTGVTVAVNPGGNFAAGTYHLITYSGSFTDNSSSFSGWTATGLPVGNTATFSNTGTSIDMVVAAVPEPSTWAMMAGGVGMLTLLQRRRRRG
jgi:fibronectin-binding autotransporter adhesin